MTSRSVWQRPLACTRTSTSCGPSGPRVTRSTTSGRPTSCRTAARKSTRRAGLAEPLGGGTPVEHLALPLHDRGVALPRGGIEIGGGRLLVIEVVVVVDPAHEGGGVPHLRELPHAGRDVADRLAHGPVAGVAGGRAGGHAHVVKR